MISTKVQETLKGSSAIRAMFMEGKELAMKVGAENVYDFSLGNPAVPAPQAFRRAITDALEHEDLMVLHGYMDNSGFPEVRRKIADNLNRRFGTHVTYQNLVMTVGAAGGLNIILKTILNPGSEVIVFAPFFGEYKSYVANFGGKLVIARSDKESFQPDISDLEEKITPKTAALLINTPNNPTGVIYSPETMKQIAGVLEQKQKEYGTDIYLISDEPYRELVYDGASEDFLTKYYPNTIVGYSFSKSLSIPGERIGYVLVPDEVKDSELLLQGLNVSNRTLGFVNAPSLMQKAVGDCLDEKTDVAFYDRNRCRLYEALTQMGFTCVKPEGAFYLWMKSPVDEEEEFVQAAKKYHILLVKGSAFGCGGYVRLAYCVSPEMIERSLPAFSQLAAEYIGR